MFFPFKTPDLLIDPIPTCVRSRSWPLEDLQRCGRPPAMRISATPVPPAAYRHPFLFHQTDGALWFSEPRQPILVAEPLSCAGLRPGRRRASIAPSGRASTTPPLYLALNDSDLSLLFMIEPGALSSRSARSPRLPTAHDGRISVAFRLAPWLGRAASASHFSPLLLLLPLHLISIPPR